MVDVRPLRSDHDRTRFRSGDDDLDRFFHQFAGQNQFRHHLGVTYVAVADGAIVGGVGLLLLRLVLRLAIQMADGYGCVGVVVDARPAAEAFYRKYGFVAVEAVEGRSEARPAPIPMFLSLRAIRDAVR